MRTASTSRSRGRKGAVAAGLALLTALLLTACGSDEGSADAPTSHPVDDTSITAEVGERFTLTVEENASTRSHWYLVDPKPDSAVVRSEGQDGASESDFGGDPVPGANSRLTFTFEATGKGSTEIVLMHCTFSSTCDTGTGSPAPTPTGPVTPTEPERVTYTVTVD
ncbi:protease inhibitor I42 family protein [Streptomyces sp. NPDC006527]|uniref:protease inhibitor I42 family protein n=1 Tax=Streptomyces sp. NPDC006527 TaxID=3364749 RepID=UPI0036AE143A